MTNQGRRHVPVLLQDAIEFLHVRRGATIADCTLGLAEDMQRKLSRRLGPQGHLIGFDRDSDGPWLLQRSSWIRS